MLNIVIVLAICTAPLAALYWRHYRTHIACRRYCKSNANLEGKTAIITGASSGIGKATALDLARRGAQVILGCCDLQQAQDAAEEIKVRTGNSKVVVRHLDLASLQSVREFARKTIESEERLDILVNNAGVPDVGNENLFTKDNFHLVFGINYFGHFLLTNLLLDLLKKSAPSRVITVASIAHSWETVPLDLTREDLSYKAGDTTVDVGRRPGASQDRARVLYPHLRTYGQSKLAGILFSRELARRLESTGVTSVTVHPGFVNTPIWQYFKCNLSMAVLYYTMWPIMWFLMIDEEAGAQTTLHCALDETVAKLPGRFFANCAVAQTSELARDDEQAQRLWDISCQATGIEERSN
ncbi:retinol dehydrogenase 11-like [Acanthaster planci]|uniref:Retinol dehydrogenase 11-like n=1 Tax=Acanthaster planci TaxID=133434 RepID=A0A8B7YYA1_ACAPL|nr:retinol dehydrogenase 11-like [Acanthaster planci]